MMRPRATPDFSGRSLDELLSLDGRTALVTGGARGIGRASCTRLSEAGAAIVVADLDEDAANAAAAELGNGAVGCRLDITDPESVAAAADATCSSFGGIDVWVNAAGIYPVSSILEMTPEAWHHVIDTNLTGVFLGAQAAARAMVASARRGVIVNVSSTAAYRVGGVGTAHYVASKFGGRGLTQALANELGPFDIRVLGVAPTVTATPGLEERRLELEMAGFKLDELGAALPLGRIAAADDVARVVLFCASDLAALMTGSTLLVDAGELAC